MIDFHCHILPKMDDGSDSLETSLEMLKMEEQQGIDTVILTPHYYIQNEEPDSFFKRRQEAYDTLVKSYQGKCVLKKGCEVHYFRGISQADFIEDFCVENSNLLLLELPFSRKANLVEVAQLNCRVQVVLAHIERYLSIYSKEEMDEFLRNGIYLQCNGEVFNKKNLKGILKDYFEQGKIMYLGSDAHNLEERKPNLVDAYEYIQSKYSKELLKDLDERGRKKI